MCQIAIDNRCYTTVACQCLHKLVNKITYKKDKKSIDFGPRMAYNIDNSRDTTNKQEKETMIMKSNKVWGFNCFGVCVVLISEDRIDAYNEKHPNFAEKVVSWEKA